MKFINYLESISGIGIFPMISLLTFFIFFVLVGVVVYFMDENSLNEAVHLPLEKDQIDSIN
jgi:cytochrome c oxidase cbb3-type subunit 3